MTKPVAAMATGTTRTLIAERHYVVNAIF